MRIGLGLRALLRTFLALGEKGTARGEPAGAVWQSRRFDDEAEGESGELGEGTADLVAGMRRKVGPLEGERDRERRSCARAEDASTL